jgi:hypothetical protein
LLFEKPAILPNVQFDCSGAVAQPEDEKHDEFF